MKLYFLNQCFILFVNNPAPSSPPTPLSLRWRHNGCDSVSNHQPHDCLLNRLFRRRSEKTSKLRHHVVKIRKEIEMDPESFTATTPFTISIEYMWYMPGYYLIHVSLYISVLVYHIHMHSSRTIFAEADFGEHYGDVIMGTTAPHHCLLNRLFGCRSTNTPKLRVAGLCAGNSNINMIFNS